jgi:hypothetical protein
MNLLFHITADSLKVTYGRMKNVLQGHDMLIFNAMASATEDRRHQFVPPLNQSEYEQKHAEIEKMLSYPGVLRGTELAFRLMEEVLNHILQSGGLPGTNTDDLMDAISFSTNQDALIRLNPQLRWMVEWAMELKGTEIEAPVFLDVYDKNLGTIVPNYVVEYISTSIYAYKQGMYATSVALLTIALEATLRDVLATKGYVFDIGASPVDVYPYVNASVGVDGDHYTLTFRDPMPKSPAELSASAGGQPSVEIRIRRLIKPWKKRTDLAIITPPILLDHWSSRIPVQQAQRSVSGLGEALDLSRNKENLLTPYDLPLDLDEVILAVRNNLIHLSGDALTTHLTMIDAQGDFTLGDFLDNDQMVFDLIVDIPRVINQLYIDLREKGHLA